MTDKELIARLLYLSRVTRDYDQEDMTSADYAGMPVATKEAAARIEALIEESARRLALARSEGVARVEQFEHIEALEAKLAKAVETLEYYAVEALPWEADDSLLARATLAQIKGESHE